MPGCDQVASSKKWRYAKVWDYSISHSCLRVRLDESDQGLFLHGCEKVYFVPGWEVGQFEITQYDGEHPRHRVKDGDFFDVDCVRIYFSEDMFSHPV